MRFFDYGKWKNCYSTPFCFKKSLMSLTRKPPMLRSERHESRLIRKYASYGFDPLSTWPFISPFIWLTMFNTVSHFSQSSDWIIHHFSCLCLIFSNDVKVCLFSFVPHWFCVFSAAGCASIVLGCLSRPVNSTGLLTDRMKTKTLCKEFRIGRATPICTSFSHMLSVQLQLS